MLQNGSIWVQNNTKYEYGQKSPKLFLANNLIFIHPISMVTNIFGYSFAQKNDICPTLGQTMLHTLVTRQRKSWDNEIKFYAWQHLLEEKMVGESLES